MEEAIMGLFDRRKRDESKPEAVESEPDESDSEDQPIDGAATWYRAISLNVVPAGDDVLLHDPDRPAPIVLPAFELDLLAQCTHFAPVEEHAAQAARTTGLPADGVTQRLYDMVDRGLLVSQHEVLARARGAAERDPTPAPMLDRVAVITNDRPASLSNCLQSYRKQYGAELELVVFDDSADAAVRGENRRIAETAGGRVLYAGEKEKREFVAELSARVGIEQSVVGAALTDFDGSRFHCGANRNAVLLDAAGGAVLMIDDDTTARAVNTADAGDSLRLSSRYDPWSLHFFTGVEKALDAAKWQSPDLLAWHRRFLGSSPSACAFGRAAGKDGLPLDTDGATVDLNEADSALIDAFSGGRGRVVATAAGVAGDSGMGLPLYFLSLQGAARERLLENYEAYRATRGVHRGAPEVTISNSQIFMGAHVAFDVRDTIPPFPPVLRNSDGVFGVLLRTCMPQSYLAFLPWLVEHAPPELRAADFEQVLRSIGRVRASDVIRDLAHAYEPAPGVTEPTVRLPAFGQYLIGLGAMPSDDFDAFIRHQIVARVGSRIEGLTRTVNRYDGQPDGWAKDCVDVAAEGLRSLTEDEIGIADTPGNTPMERTRHFQRLIDRFGRIIEAWPRLLAAAGGMRVARPLG
jgi:hypothetical protein